MGPINKTPIATIKTLPDKLGNKVKKNKIMKKKIHIFSFESRPEAE